MEQVFTQILGVLCALWVVLTALKVLDLFEEEHCCAAINAEKREAFRARILAAKTPTQS